MTMTELRTCTRCGKEFGHGILIRKNIEIYRITSQTSQNDQLHKGIIDDYFCNPCFTLILDRYKEDL